RVHEPGGRRQRVLAQFGARGVRDRAGEARYDLDPALVPEPQLELARLPQDSDVVVERAAEVLGAEAVHLLLHRAGHDQGAREAALGGPRGARDHAGQGRLHVDAAAAPQSAAVDGARERGVRPLLRVPQRDRVEVAGEEELGPGAARDHADRVAYVVDVRLVEPGGEHGGVQDLRGGRLLARGARRHDQLAGELERVRYRHPGHHTWDPPRPTGGPGRMLSPPVNAHHAPPGWLP